MLFPAFCVDDIPLPGHLSNRTSARRELFRRCGALGLFSSQNARVFFFFSNPPNLKCTSEFRSLVSSLGTSARSIFCVVFRKKRDRVKPRNERFGSLHETRACFDFRLRAFSLRRAEIIDAFSRFHTNAKTREPHFAAGVLQRKNVRVGCIARRTRTLLQHSRDERLRDSRASARVRPRRAPDGHRALRRRRVPPLPPAGASPIREKGLSNRKTRFASSEGRSAGGRASPRRARTRAHRDEPPRIRRPNLPTSPRARFRTSTASHPRSSPPFGIPLTLVSPIAPDSDASTRFAPLARRRTWTSSSGWISRARSAGAPPASACSTSTSRCATTCAPTTSSTRW